MPRCRAASLRATNPSGISGTKRARASSVRWMRHGAPGVACSAGSRPSLSQRRTVDVETPSSLAACSMVKAAGVGRRRGGDASAFRAPLTRVSVNGSPVPVRRPWRLRTAAIWRSGWCAARRPISSIVFSSVRRLSPPRRTSGRRARCARRPPRTLRRRRRSRGVDGDHSRPQACAAVPCGHDRWCLRGPQLWQLAREAGQRAALVLGERRGPACSSAASARCSRSTLGERLLELALQRAGDKTVLGLARVELALRAAGLELRALEREAPAGQARVVLLAELADRAGGGGHARRGHGLEKHRGDRLVQAPAAECLACALGAVEDVPAHARIAHATAVPTRIGDLHLAPTSTAAQQPLQQRAALARGAAALPARSHVGPQSLAGGEVLLPGHIAGMVLGQADGPLLQRHLDGPRPDLARRVQPLLLAGAAEHERSRIGGVGEEVVHGRIVRLAQRTRRSPTRRRGSFWPSAISSPTI